MAETKPSVTLPEATRQPKTVPMKWLKLGEAKDPEFRTEVFLFRPDHENEPYYTIGNLREKKETDETMVYGFHNNMTGEVETDFTFYAICKPPVE